MEEKVNMALSLLILRQKMHLPFYNLYKRDAMAAFFTFGVRKLTNTSANKQVRKLSNIYTITHRHNIKAFTNCMLQIYD